MGKTPTTSQKRKSTRVLLTSPFNTTCSPVAEAVEKRILGHLTNLAESVANKNNDIRKEVIFGLNAVSRGVERNMVCAVLVARPVHPQILCQHLTSLCSHKAIPLLAHSQLNGSVPKLFGLSSLMTMALKKSAESSSSTLHTMYKEIVGAAARQVGNPTIPSELERAKVTYIIPKVEVPVPKKALNSSGEQHFLALSHHPVFPDPDYPRELDTIKMRVIWSMADLQPSGDSPDNSSPTPEVALVKKYLIEAQTESVVSSGKIKTKKKKEKKK